MPYRRFPKTDTARLRSLGVLLDNNDVYAAKSRFISMDVITQAKKLHDQLKTLSSQFLLCYEAQMRNYKRVAKPQKYMMMYLQHFVRVLLMGVERGEIKSSALSEYYAIENADETLRLLHNVEDANRIAPMVIKGEKKRIALEAVLYIILPLVWWQRIMTYLPKFTNSSVYLTTRPTVRLPN